MPYDRPQVKDAIGKYKAGLTRCVLLRNPLRRLAETLRLCHELGTGLPGSGKKGRRVYKVDGVFPLTRGAQDKVSIFAQ